MKIARVAARWLHRDIPYERQHVSDFGRVASFDTTLVEVETDDGIIGWGEAKQLLFEHLDAMLAEPRERYAELTAHPERIEKILREGAEKARAEAGPYLSELRKAVGFKPLG